MAKSAIKAGSAELELFLADHARSCLHTVETWMLRSLPVPRGVIETVLPDPAWAKVLRDAWVIAVGAEGAVDRPPHRPSAVLRGSAELTLDREAGGLFRGVDPKRGIGVVDREGETIWIASAQLLVPHPVLLDEIDDLRDLAVQIGATQGLSQLFRETFARPSVAPGDPLAVATFAGGSFSMMQQATNLAKDLGYRVSGGAAVCRVLERGRWFEARFDLGGGDPMGEATTGELAWVDDRQHPLPVLDVPPVAYSEGMRMASLIHARRQVDGASDDA